MVKLIFPSSIDLPLHVLQELKGYYECPKDNEGKRLGPLVGYAGRDDQDRQYVGDVYANFAKIERCGPALSYVVHRLEPLIRDCLKSVRFDANLTSTLGFCGAPEGGKALAATLAAKFERSYIFPEKKVTALATSTSREKSELFFERHEPEPGEHFFIAEDVCNNFSTTAKLVSLIERYGATVIGVICFLNRSLEINTEFRISPDRFLPVVAVVRKPIDQWKQDDPAVAADVAAGNVVWKPKIEWERLEEAMKR